MEQWHGKVAVVTGASSGMGAATAIELALAGMIVIGLARRPKLINSLNEKLVNTPYANNIHSAYCDVTNLKSITNTFKWIDRKYKQVDVLVNSAGIVRLNYILGGGNGTMPSSSFELKNVIDTNLMGSIYTTRAAFRIMQRNNNYGHIIQIISEWGQIIPTDAAVLQLLNTYPVSKLGVSAAADVIRLELNAMGNKKVKFSAINPGVVKTNILAAAGYPNVKQFYEINPYIEPKDIADTILYLLGTPRNLLVQEMVVKPVGG